MKLNLQDSMCIMDTGAIMIPGVALRIMFRKALPRLGEARVTEYGMYHTLTDIPLHTVLQNILDRHEVYACESQRVYICSIERTYVSSDSTVIIELLDGIPKRRLTGNVVTHHFPKQRMTMLHSSTSKWGEGNVPVPVPTVDDEYAAVAKILHDAGIIPLGSPEPDCRWAHFTRDPPIIVWNKDIKP